MLGSDALLLAKLAGCGHDTPGLGYDLSRASPALRPLVERLLAASIAERHVIWNEFLAGRSRQAFAVAAAPQAELEPMQQPTVLSLDPPGKPSAAVAPAPAEPVEPERGVRMTCTVQLEPREVEWLWAGRVPLGMITLFAGDPKLGKSFVTLAIAAALSRGLALHRATCRIGRQARF